MEEKLLIKIALGTSFLGLFLLMFLVAFFEEKLELPISNAHADDTVRVTGKVKTVQEDKLILAVKEDITVFVPVDYGQIGSGDEVLVQGQALDTNRGRALRAESVELLTHSG